MMVGVTLVSALPIQVHASTTGYVLETVIPDKKLLKGDTFNLTIEFALMDDTTGLKSMTVSGSAIANDDYRYDFMNPITQEVVEGKVGLGQVVCLEVRGLEYSGEGNSFDVSIQYDGGTLKHTVAIDTLTNEDVKGALILDPTVTSNMSMQLASGESKQMQLTIQNTSKETIEESIVKINLQETTVGLAITEGQYLTIDKLKAGASKTIQFVVEASDSVPAGTYKINASINGMEQTILLQVTNDEVPAVLQLSYDEAQVCRAGEVTPLTLNIHNAGDVDAQNVKVYMENSEGIGLVGTSNMLAVGTVTKGETKAVHLNVMVDASVNTTLATVPFTIVYSNKQGEVFEETQKLYVATDASSEVGGDVRIGVVQPSTAVVGAGDAFKIGFEVLADGDVDNVKVTVTAQEGILATSQNIFTLNQLTAETPQYLEVAYVATEDAAQGYQPIAIGVTYEQDGTTQQHTQYSGVTMSATDDDYTSQAKVIVGGYQVEPAQLVAGETGVLTVQLTNTHPTETIHNLTATYATLGDLEIIQPIGSGNTLYGGRIAPGQTVTQTLQFNVAKTAQAKDYPIEATLSYEVNEGQEVQTTQSLIAPVTKNTLIQIGALEDSTLTPGKATALTIPLYNRGDVALENVMIYLEGEGFTVKDNELYINSFAEGATEYYLPTLTPTGNDISVALVAEYENSDGVLEKTVYPLPLSMTTTATPSGGMEGFENMSKEERMQAMEGMSGGKGMRPGTEVTTQTTQSIPTWVVGAIAGLGLLGSFLGYRWLKKRKQLKGSNNYENL